LLRRQERGEVSALVAIPARAAKVIVACGLVTGVLWPAAVAWADETPPPPPTPTTTTAEAPPPDPYAAPAKPSPSKPKTTTPTTPVTHAHRRAYWKDRVHQDQLVVTDQVYVDRPAAETSSKLAKK